MLDFPGSAVSGRGSYFEIIEQTVLASGAMTGQPRRVSRYLNIARQFINGPLRIGLLGEINSGKTELANLILGVKVLPSSVINNTHCPTLIRFGEVASVRHYQSRKSFSEKDASDLHKLVQQSGYLVECLLPHPLLKSIEIVDFPSFENFDPCYESASALIRRNDLLVWCSSSIRTWTASEKSAWEQLPDDLKQACLFTVTHADKLSPAALDAVMERLGIEAGPSGVEPISIATISANQARSPRGQIVNRNLWETSGGAEFFKKLGQLLQQSIVKRQERLDSSMVRFSMEPAPASDRRIGEAELMDEWDILKQRFASADAEAHDANFIVQAMQEFKTDICREWLLLRERPHDEIDQFLALFPDDAEQITSDMRYVSDDRLLSIFFQIECEIKEYIALIECQEYR